MRYFLLVLMLVGMSVAGYSQKIYAPNATSSLTGAATYCQNASPGLLTYTYTTCSSGAGTATGTDLTITWYANTVNSTVGGTVQSTTFVSSSTAATGNTTFLPTTVDAGTTYYYCVITWNGTGLCNTSGSLTSPTAAVVVNTAPDVITGTTVACVGTQVTLSNSVAGGTWTSSATTKASINSATGMVTAVAAGTATISYSIGSCRSTTVFTVNANPAAITGTNAICQGATTTFADATAGGTWSTSNSSIASINASSPVTITGGAAGSANITYTLNTTGCYATRPITVNTAPAAITGTLSACVGTLTTLSNTVGGGTWTSATVAKATIDASGVVSAVAAGTSVISYTIGSCRSTATFTVNANPAAISGTNVICQGAITTFTDATAGGTWSTSNSSVATVNASNPVGITGGAAGTANISYTLGTGCYATRPITVNTAPGAITGTLSACVGTLTTLSNSVAGGTWTSATTTRATIDASGVVTAVSAGTSVISYTIGSCRSTATFTANAVPAAITGTNVICRGSSTTFADATTGGTWSSTNTGIATVAPVTPGIVTGVGTGTATISYTLNTGCYATRDVTVNLAPGPITGSLSSCVGVVTALSDTVAGGTWTSATTTKATIDASSGMLTAVAAGTSVISYTIGSCRSTATFTVNTTPVAITGTNTVCEGSVTTFTDATAGGTWTTADGSVATVNASNPVGITGVNAGNTTITYAIGSCYVTRGVTVNNAPSAIGGASSVCIGFQTTLTNTEAGGVWSSSVTSRATINASTGVVSGLTAGNVVISYTLGSCRSTLNFAVNSNPGAINGSAAVCEQSTIVLADGTAGGAWSSSNAGIASVSDGTVTGVNSGTATISYIMPTGCYSVKAVTVNPTPQAITGPVEVCQFATATFSDATSSGTWSSSNTSRATINSSTGVLTALNAGAVTVSYTSGSCSVMYPITILASPNPITGGSNVCEGATMALADVTPLGDWSSADNGIATVANDGTVYGVSSGTVNITYNTGCGAPAVKNITVDITPNSFTGSNNVCVGAVTALSNNDAGGTWSSETTAVATVDAAGNVTGVTTGTSVISYTLGSCLGTTTVTVNPNPASITGTNQICEGASTTFDNVTGGGTWSVNTPAIASVNAATPVTVSGISAGTAVVSYTLGTGCYSTKSIQVNANPAAISGVADLCEGAVTTFSDATGGGTWATGTPSVATIDNHSPVNISGITAGTSTISYTLPTGCYATRNVTVHTAPAAISGNTLVCTENPVTFSDAIAGGTWSSSNEATATVNASSGVVHGVSAGGVTITYTIGSCYTTYATTVNSLPAMPAAITGSPLTFCRGTVVTLSDATAGGTWSSTNTAAATITADGAVTGVAGGTSTISYAVTNSCGTVATTQGVTVVDYPSASITSADNACYNYATNIVFSGTSGAVITYKIDGGADQTQTLTGGTYSLSTGAIVSAHNYELVEVHNATCATSVDTTVTVSTIPMQWVGGALGHESDWNNANNWSCGFVPDVSADVTIPAGTTYTPQIGASVTNEVRTLTIASGARISAGSNANLFVKSSLTNNGTFDGDGVLALTGTSAQTISGKGKVSHLGLNNTAGAIINSGARVIVTKSLLLVAGTLTTNDSLVMNSDSSYNAWIEPIGSGSAISGNVKVLQYIPGGYRRYRFWSHPFSSTISLSQVEQYIDITGRGGAANGFTTTASNNASSFRYDPLVANSSAGYDPGWREFTQINAAAADTNRFHRYQGIRLFIRGTKGQGLGYTNDIPNPVTIAMTGPVNQGDQTVVLTKGSSTLQDYNMIGNPYAAPVDLGTVAYNAKEAGAITGTAFYIWNPFLGAGGQYVTVPIGIGAASPYYIQANTCFQVRAAYNGATMYFTEANKSGTANTNLLKQSPEYVSLQVYDVQDHLWDMLRVKFDNNATAAEDNDHDAQKMAGPDFNFYTLSSDAQRLSIDARPFDEHTVIPVGISSAYKQEFVIKADEVVVPDGKEIYLHDKLLNNYTVLQPGAEYRFTIGADQASQGDNRFELSMKPATAVVSNSVVIALTPNPATDIVNITFKAGAEEKVSVRMMDISGVNVYSADMGTISNGTINIPLKDMPAGVYMIEVTYGSKKSVKRLIKE